VLFWIGPILLYVVMPTLDLRFGADGRNPPDEATQRLEDDKYYRFCTYCLHPVPIPQPDPRRFDVRRAELELVGSRRPR